MVRQVLERNTIKMALLEI